MSLTQSSYFALRSLRPRPRLPLHARLGLVSVRLKNANLTDRTLSFIQPLSPLVTFHRIQAVKGQGSRIRNNNTWKTLTLRHTQIPPLEFILGCFSCRNKSRLPCNLPSSSPFFIFFCFCFFCFVLFFFFFVVTETRKRAEQKSLEELESLPHCRRLNNINHPEIGTTHPLV